MQLGLVCNHQRKNRHQHEFHQCYQHSHWFVQFFRSKFQKQMYFVIEVMLFCWFKSKFIFVLSIDRVWLILCQKDADQIIFLTMVVKDGYLIQGNHFEWTTMALCGGCGWNCCLSRILSSQAFFRWDHDRKWNMFLSFGNFFKVKGEFDSIENPLST